MGPEGVPVSDILLEGCPCGPELCLGRGEFEVYQRLERFMYGAWISGSMRVSPKSSGWPPLAGWA